MSRRKSTKTNKSKQQSANAKRARPRNRRPRPSMANGIDDAGMRFARLLADPCSAPLSKSVFPGSDGAILFRSEVDYTSTADSGAIFYVPNALTARYYQTGTSAFTAYSNAFLVGSGGSDTTAFGFAPSATSGSTPAAALTALTNASPTAPGLKFLVNSASTVRAVASCVQLSYVGSELNRSGTAFSAILPADFAYDLSINATSGVVLPTQTTASLRALCDKVERMPTGIVERRWLPSSGDQDFYPSQSQGTSGSTASATPTNVFTDPTDYAKINGVLVGWSNQGGVPTSGSNGVRIRIVTVYEWNPVALNGISYGRPRPSPSVSTLNQILNFLERSTSDWTYSGALSAAGRVGRLLNLVPRMTPERMMARLEL